MKNYLLAIIFIFFNSCNNNTSNDVIDGQVEKNYLFKSSNTKWFPKNYELYETDIFLSENNFSNLDNYSIELYMGVILFIDEIHTIINSDRSSADISSLLKPLYEIGRAHV